MGGNMALGPLRRNVPRSPAGSAPVTGRWWSVRSSATGAKVPWSHGLAPKGSTTVWVGAVMGGTVATPSRR